MSKIFIVGDFHGEFSKELINKIGKEKPNFILSTGDFCGSDKAAKFYFKYIHGKNFEEISERIKNHYYRLEKDSFERGKKVVEKLKNFGIKTYSVHGNWDPCPYPSDIFGERKDDNFSFKKIQDRNFRFIDFSLINEGDFILIGGGSSASPGIISKKIFKKNLKKQKNIKEKILFVYSFFRAILEYRRREVALTKIFSKAKKIKKKIKKPIIFLTHNCPYGTKIDIVKKGVAKGEHKGSFLEKEIIKKFQPDFVFCGHIHEGFGKTKLGKTKIINPGAVKEGRFLIFKI